MVTLSFDRLITIFKRAVLLNFVLLVLASGLAMAIRANPQEPNQDHDKYQTYGAPSRLAGKPLSLSEAVQSTNLDKPVRVQSEVQDVCRMKGCWMVLTDGTRSVRVTFKDYGFFVAKDIAGKTVIAEGVISEKILSQEMARHYAEDAGKSQKEIEKIVGDQKELTMIAETVLVLK
jgi:hypothetical protein